MTNVELIKVEEQGSGRLLFSVRVPTAAGKMEFPIAIDDQGSQALNEMAVLRSAIVFAAELEASVRHRLGAAPQPRVIG
ncbi:hypothetical protein FZC33_00815 [Labrys sp. KNU-23]|uniref:hypothetical protein n=1 Tax=Labrys sp. KNU-23 TaxID=2789216 RepID=UPI0011EDC9B5|nr:hypothetical protein [Labrys sp. KNU-23]QEN84859.1 hypothetical protein FZC33_00815 [Labrys sp. KNU-23]